MLMDEFHIEEGVSIQLDKHIPVAAGMAGGSSNAAAVLFGMNRMFSLGLSQKELMERGRCRCSVLYYARNRAGRRNRRDSDAIIPDAEMLCSYCKTGNKCIDEDGL